jgi:hypothetical protein
MRYIDAAYDTVRAHEVIRAIERLADKDTIVEDEKGNVITSVKLFEETLSDGSKVPHLVLYFEEN